ncbi:MerR family Transcriptional regulator [Bifidobacterium saguini DSM 23967]|uniref:MerR family Transcriptional regulator n=2 Tax=Bifidobacterium saguini TaxID=762210 RepID=A0A087D8D4_9BIFI|nr:ECF transporter S component [Bifidobacterium saguini]KFI91784.1 MerR family Transcriptional regulator [Bifidobacterium saguini DSM 23967]QTB90200.1 ECF transporter S component [Bifidobacterium saguini]
MQTDTAARTYALPSVKFQSAAAVLAVIAAVALPQIFHVAGAALGLGTALGQILLPMHLPVLLVGLLAGPYAGVATGAFAPVISFALTGMPMAPMVPFMVIELAAYGLFAGLLRGVRLPNAVPSPIAWLIKLLGAQVAGRVIDAIAIAVAVYLLGNAQMSIASVAAAVVTGLPGLILQWIAIPVIMFAVDRKRD